MNRFYAMKDLMKDAHFNYDKKPGTQDDSNATLNKTDTEI